MEALVRELHEELGAQVQKEDGIFLGALSEGFTGHSELVHVHFWHDKEGTITGVYECEGRYYDSVEEALSHDKVMDYVRWALCECRDRGLLK